MRWDRNGFTLIELLVVIAIVAILAVLAAGGVQAFLDRGRLSEAVNTIDRHVGDARRIAKRTDTPVEFQVNQVPGGGVQLLRDGVVVAGLGQANLSSGNGATVTFDPPFGTNGGADVSYGISVGGAAATVNVVGVLGQTVVTR